MRSILLKVILTVMAVGTLTFTFQNCAPPMKFEADVISTKLETPAAVFCPEEERSCETPQGFGLQTCQVVERGLVYSPCVESQCKAGFFLASVAGDPEGRKVCTPGDCSSGEEKVCENISHGTGIRKCENNRWGMCQLTCEAGYYVDPTTNNCRPHFVDISMKGAKAFDAVLPPMTAQNPVPVSVYPLMVTASPGVVLADPVAELAYVSGSCLATDTKPALVITPWYYAENAEFAFGVNEWHYNRQMAQNFGGCTFKGTIFGQTSDARVALSDSVVIRMKATADVCEKSQYYSNSRCNLCKNDIPTNASYNNMGGDNPTCAFACNAGYALVNNQCLPKVCTPADVKACPITNGTGTQVCNATGTEYSACTLASCSSGYVKSGETCVPATCTGTPPPNAVLCAADNTGLSTNVPVSLVGSCTTTKKCEYICDSGFDLSGTTCVPKVCSPGTSTACVIANGLGTKVCDSTGKGYGTCTVTSCDIGYVQSGNTCVAAACTGTAPTNASLCSGDNTGLTMNVAVSLVGSCTTAKKCEYTCNNGYYFNGTSCVAQICSPGTSRACSVTNGVGSQTCDSQGSAYGSCTVTSCNSGYVQSGDSCVAAMCTGTAPSNASLCSGDNTGLTMNVAVSLVSTCTTTKKCEYTCNSGYYFNGTSCVAQVCSPGTSRSCTVTNGIGSQACDTQGSSYGSCTLTSCNSGYVQSGDSCVAAMCTGTAPTNASLCSGDNTGLTMNTAVSLVSACTTTKKCEYTCDSGYYFNGTSCVAQACAPGTSRSCTVTNGVGTQTCDSQGNAYGSCTLTSCNSGYVQNGNSCVAAECTGTAPTNASLCSGDNTGLTMNTAISLVSSCTTAKKCEYACNSGFYFNGTSCVAQTCSPGTSRSCSVTNGVGSQTCDSQGSAYGSCTLTSCNSGYVQSGSSCVAAMCTGTAPTNASLCSGDNAGLTVNTAVSLVSACTTTKKCEYTCNGGFYFNGTSCVAQTCSPGTSRSCSVTNGVGSQTCDSQGSAYGSCTVTSCNSGYQLVGGSCVALPSRTIITGVAYCAEYQDGAGNNWGWGCGGNGRPSTWTMFGTAVSGGCSSGTMTDVVRNAAGQLLGYSCVSTTTNSDTSNEIVGAAYCNPGRNQAQGCGSGTTSTWKFVGSAISGGGCTQGTQSRPIYSPGGIVGYACIKGSVTVNQVGQQPSMQTMITGAAYCAETAGFAPNFYCPSWTTVGNAVASGSGSCSDGGQVSNQKYSLSSGGIVGFTCKKSMFTISGTDYYTGSAYCAENPVGTGGCGVGATSTWILNGTGQSGGCQSGHSVVNAIVGKGGTVGYTCRRN